jgi:RNA polymerase sigma-70 factor, ECF subfamily
MRMDYSKLTPQELVRECARSNDAQAWDEFIRVFSPVIVGTVRRVARRYGESSPEAHADLAQEVFLKLCENNRHKLHQMDPSPTANCHGFLKVVALNYARDHFKNQHAKKRGSGAPTENLDDSQPTSPSCSPGSEGDIELQILWREVKSRLVALGFSEKECAMFDLSCIQGLTAAEIAHLPWVGLSVKGVESALRRMKIELRGFFASRGGFSAGTSS